MFSCNPRDLWKSLETQMSKKLYIINTLFKKKKKKQKPNPPPCHKNPPHHEKYRKSKLGFFQLCSRSLNLGVTSSYLGAVDRWKALLSQWSRMESISLGGRSRGKLLSWDQETAWRIVFETDWSDHIQINSAPVQTLLELSFWPSLQALTPLRGIHDPGKQVQKAWPNGLMATSTLREEVTLAQPVCTYSLGLRGPPRQQEQQHPLASPHCYPYYFSGVLKFKGSQMDPRTALCEHQESKWVLVAFSILITSANALHIAGVQ